MTSITQSNREIKNFVFQIVTALIRRASQERDIRRDFSNQDIE